MPLIIMLNLGTQKEAAVAGVVFVWIVSFLGLVSRLQYNSINLLEYIPLITAAILGGFLGSYLGSFKYSAKNYGKIFRCCYIDCYSFFIKKIV
ncbi:hypothetical protein [Bathymodiolus heckerae thiotrophic gill symbiont]|uniref:hypothetical protein n=1 Tax=Bathymodiolus heckerae thiotrophic gill symbiont TaxID=1052212 RepID=UPI0010FD67C9|nr:hypothetical protein [Bathymodiolus heckerae thiotrophic gill symbiont]